MARFDDESDSVPFRCDLCGVAEVKDKGDRCGSCVAAMAEDADERHAEQDADRRLNEQREDV